MDRVTSKMLDNMVGFIAKKIGAPTEVWRKVNGKNEATVGAIFLDRNSPGDGWTRYRLTRICSAGGGESDFGTARSFNAQEMYAYLRGFEDAVEHTTYKI